MTGQSFSSCLCMYLFWWHLKSKWAVGWLNCAPAYETYVHCDVLEVLCRLCYIICLLGGPELFVLFASEALVVVAFAFEQLLIVGFTVKFTLKSCEGAKAAGKGGMKPLYTNKKESGEEESQVNKQGNSVYSHLSLALQCLQQKHVEWKTRLLATNLSIG